MPEQKERKHLKYSMLALENLEKVGKYDMCKVSYRGLINNQNLSSWFSVETIGNLQVQRGSNQKIQKKKIHKRLREMVKQPKDQFDEQEWYISFDPLCDGNCQFNSIRRIFREFGFQGSPKSIKSENSFIFGGKYK